MKITKLCWGQRIMKRHLSFAIASTLLTLPLGAQTIVTKTLDPGPGTEPGVGKSCSQVVVNGNPAVSYHDEANRDLKYVRALDASGTNWGTPIVVESDGNTGQETSLQVVNGNPAICYWGNSSLKYVRALDANGTTWGTPVVVVGSLQAGYTSLEVINGNPAFSYYDVTDSALKYVRALDANGTTWGTPVTVDNSGSVGQFTSMEVVNGNPAISYHVGNDFLRYVRALDANGTTWGTPVTVDGTVSADNVGQWTSLEVVNGNPAISYRDAANTDLKYVRALDVDGTSWNASITIDGSTDDDGYFTSLKVVNGKPAIAYDNFTNRELRYVQANDASGANWDAPIVVDSDGYVGQYASMALVNGNPAISHHDATNGALKWAIILPGPTPTPGPSAQVGNISTRLAVGTGDNALIGGFIITGTQPKRVIIRAIGPSLPLQGLLANPILEFHQSDGTVITNDNWRDTQESEIQATGIAPTNDLESAIIATLPLGAHTAIVRGVDNATGVGLVEVYDLDSAADSRMANVSTRGFVQTGNDVLIGGTIITGSGSTDALIRAIGPSLASAGVAGALEDPTLELRDGNAALVASNDQWQETQQAAIQATGLAPTHPFESAILQTLSPGGYTAIVRGKNEGTGVGLVEVYALQ